MQENSVVSALREVVTTYNIDEYELLDRLEDALAKEYEKRLHLINPCRVTVDPVTGGIFVYELVPVNDEELAEDPEAEPIYEEHDITPASASRDAAREAKKAIDELIKEAKVKRIIQEYQGRIGDMVTGTVLQSKSQMTSIKLGEDVEATLPRKEQIPNERYYHNDRIRVLITNVEEVKKGSDGYVITVSRTHPDLVKRLFENEVPEVENGIVEIRKIVREAGVRTKVAVSSREPGLDPVGACVGPKGSRVRQIVGDLRGERIDIIPWSDDPSEFVKKALSPATVSRVTIDPDTNTATAIVPQDQFSLAIGLKGQNARLAAYLTGWRIDIKSAESGSSEVSLEGLTSTEGLADIDTRCAYVTADGERCRNHARPGSHFCGVHDPDGDAEGAETVAD